MAEATANKLTPELLLSRPHLSTLIPSTTGQHALYTFNSYDFSTHSSTSEIRLVALASLGANDQRDEQIVTGDPSAGEAVWIGPSGRVFGFLTDAGVEGETATLLNVGVLDDKDDTVSLQTAGMIPGNVGDFKATTTTIGSADAKEGGGQIRVGFVVSAMTTPKCDILGSKAAEASVEHSLGSARVYDKLPVRHWADYATPNRSALLYGVLEQSKFKTWYISDSGVTNALAGSGLECGGKGNFDICKRGIVFVAQDPEVNPMMSPKSDVYYARLENFEEQEGNLVAGLHKLSVDGLEGTASSPVWSPSGRGVAVLKMNDAIYEADRNRIVVVTYVGERDEFRRELKPWTKEGDGLFALVPEQDKWTLALVSLQDHHAVQTVWANGSVNGFHSVASADHSNGVLLTCDSLTKDSSWALLGKTEPDGSWEKISASDANQRGGMQEDQVSEVWYTGAKGQEVHAWLMTPPGFDKSKRYPLTYLIHGGPQWAWFNTWSSQPSPSVLASQGYVVFMPNITGSIGYGQAFVDRLFQNWGGSPYEDLVKGFEHVRDHMKFVDTSRAVAIGVSWGAYLVNWVQSHPFGREFKAIVADGGTFSTLKEITTDELYRGIHDFGGPYHNHREEWEKWSPSRFADRWATPELILHNEFDYRVPISEGLATFNTLQLKGIQSRMVVFPDEGHMIFRPENKLQYHVEILNWVNKFVGQLK